jgi:hypothetical protein
MRMPSQVGMSEAIHSTSQCRHIDQHGLRRQQMQRRDVLLSGAMAGVALLSERAFGQAAGKVVPWTDQPASVLPPLKSVVRGLTSW